MTILIERLRSYSLTSGYAWHCHKAADEMDRMAAEIEALRADAERYRVALEKIAAFHKNAVSPIDFVIAKIANTAIKQQKEVK